MCLYFIYIWWLLFDAIFFGMFPLVMWIYPWCGIVRPYLVQGNYILFRVNTWVTYSPLKGGNMHVFRVFILTQIDASFITMKMMYMWNNGNMSLLIQRHTSNSNMQMHTDEAMVSLDHDLVYDVVREGTRLHYYY